MTSEEREEVNMRGERRERRLMKRREHMLHHGASIGRIYQNAITKRLGDGSTKKKKWKKK